MVFADFAGKSGLGIVFSSIEKRPEGEPDILCIVTGKGPVAFELARLIDEENIARRHSNQYRLQDCVREYQRSLLESTQRELKRLYGDALVSVGFSPAAPVKRSERAIKQIFDLLLDQDSRFEGRLAQPRKPKSPLYSIDVNRRDGLNGPHIRVSAGGSYAPLPLDIVEKKLGKSYQTSSPVELLVYYGLEPPPVSGEAVDRAISDLKVIARDQLGQSQFRRIWLFDAADLEVKFASPIV